MKLSAIRGVLASALIGFSSFSTFASELTLEQLRSEVLNENLDIKIQYEKYYQANHNVGVKLGEFLPSLNLQLIYYNSTVGLLYSVVPTPSDWFNYEASQELAIAERYTTEAIKLNILRDLTANYISIKHQEIMLESYKEEEALLNTMYSRAVDMETLGAGSATDTFTARRALLQHQNDILALDSVIDINLEAMSLSLNRMPGERVVLADYVPQSVDEIPSNIDEAIAQALANSPELKANFFMQQAAQYMTSSARWSFVSFSGIGFGYPASISLEKARLREIQLEGEKLRTSIGNQLDLAYTTIANLDLRIANQVEIIQAAQIEASRTQELYDLSQASLEELTEAKRAVLQEQRDLATLKMEKEIEIAEIKRLVGQDTAGGELSPEDLESIQLAARVDGSWRGNRVVADLEISDSLANEVVSINYGGDIFNYRILNTSGNFSLQTRVRGRSGRQTITALVVFRSGQTLELITDVNL